MKNKGKVYLVGAGPAGKDLITTRGLTVLRHADVVIYDYLTDAELLAETKGGAELINCRTLGKSHKGTGLNSQARINALMVAKAKKGRIVARLKNGDPFIFGRAVEELTALRKNKIEFEVIPGVTAAQAASAYSGIPLTGRSSASSVVFVTGHESAEKEKNTIDWGAVASNGTIVLYMGVKNIAKIAHELIKAGKPAATPVAAVSNAGRINQKILVSTLEDITRDVKREKIAAPGIFIIGESVKLEKKFNWVKKNRRILNTGLSEATPVSLGTHFGLPVISIQPLDDYNEFDRLIKEIDSFNWLIFTSKYSVQYFFWRLMKTGSDARQIHGLKVAAIGAATARRLQDFGINADLVPRNESSKGLLDAFGKIGVRGKRIFFPRSDIADKKLPKELKALGAEVIEVVAYRNAPAQNLPDLVVGSFDEALFTSPSSVRGFVERYGKPPKDVTIKCIGKVSAAQAKKSGLLDG